MSFDATFLHRSARLLSAAAFVCAAALLSVGCSRKPTASAPSLVLVTFGHVPAAAVADLADMTNFAHLAEAPDAVSFRAAPLPGGVAAAQGLFGNAPAAAGYDTAAFLADPALLPAASAFATSVVPGRAIAPGVHFMPDPVQSLPYEGIRLGSVVVEAALSWLADRAGVPARVPRPVAKTAKNPAEKGEAKQAPKPAVLKAPVFLWVHLADPVFHDSPEHIRVRGSPRHAEIAFLDHQLGRIAGFLSENGLADRVLLAAVCIEGAPSNPEEAESGAWTANALPGVFPRAAEGLLSRPGETAPTPAETRPGEGLLFRLLHPNPADSNLVAECEAWRDARPDDAEAWCWLGIAQGRAKQHSEAVESHRKALALEPKSSFRMSNLGLALLGTGDIINAIDNLENAYLADPDNAQYRNTLAAVLLRTGTSFAAQGADSQAMQCFSRVVFLQPRNPQAHFVIGRQHEKMHRDALARASYRKALEILPRFKPAQAALDALDEKKAQTPPPEP